VAPGGAVERFHAGFKQHCEGDVPALTGEIGIVAEGDLSVNGSAVTAESAKRGRAGAGGAVMRKGRRAAVPTCAAVSVVRGARPGEVRFSGVSARYCEKRFVYNQLAETALAIFRLAILMCVVAAVGGCTTPGLVHEDVAGCYVVEWNSRDDLTLLGFSADSIMLTTRAHAPRIDEPLLDTLDFRKAYSFAELRDTVGVYDGQVILKDAWWWWLIEADSIRFATGHDAADLLGFQAAVRGSRLLGHGLWSNDFGPGAEFVVRGKRIACPDGQRASE
jgi:hypothetical protein